MSKGKITDFLRTGLSIGSILSGGKTKSILDAVQNGIKDESDPNNEQVLRALAKLQDDTVEVLRDFDRRLQEIERKQGVR